MTDSIFKKSYTTFTEAKEIKKEFKLENIIEKLENKAKYNPSFYKILMIYRNKGVTLEHCLAILSSHLLEENEKLKKELQTK